MLTFQSDFASVREVEVAWLRAQHMTALEVIERLLQQPHDPETVHRARVLLGWDAARRAND
jgi:hypothetical protein